MGSGDLEQSLRAEIDGYLHSHLSSLQDEIARLQSQLNEAFTRLNERLESAAQSDASVAVAISEHLRDARNAAVEQAHAEGARARASSDLALLKAAVDDIDEQRTQADILNSLINRAAGFAPRVAFFVVKNERATGWRARGLEGTVGDDAIRELSLPLSSDTLLSAVVRSRRTWSGSPGTHAEDHLIYNHLGTEPPQRIVAIPLVARDKAVAVLYADCAQQDAEAISLEAIETLVRVAGMAVELLATKRPAPSESRAEAPAQTPQSPQSPQTAEPTPSQQQQPGRFAQPQPEPERVAPAPQQPERAERFEQAERPEPIAAHEAEPAASPASAPFTRDEPAPQPLTGAPQAETVDASSRFQSPAPVGGGGARGFDAAPPVVAAQPVEEQPASSFSAPLGSRRYGSETVLPVEVSEGERRLHLDAMRFARILVDEIQLYHKQEVMEGRERGDLYRRLREDIDRSRQAYNNRVRPEVAGRYDYFHHELVNKLAGGDSSKLGEGYPGATVSA